MRVLEKIGLAQKKKEAAPLIGEKLKKEQEAYSIKFNPWIRILILLGFTILAVLALPRTTPKTGPNFVEGQPWRGDDLTAPFTFALNKSPEEIEQEQQTIRSQTPPIFLVDQSTAISIQTKIDSLYRDLQPVLQSYHDWQRSKREQVTSAEFDSIRFAQTYSTSGINLTQPSWTRLLTSYDDIQRLELPSGQFIGASVKRELEDVVDDVLTQGVIDRNKAMLELNEITVRNELASTEQSYNLSRVRDLREASEFAQFRLNREFDNAASQVAIELYNKVIQPNYLYSETASESRIQNAFSEISQNKGAIAQGQMIIRQGDLVTPDKVLVLESYARSRAQQASDLEIWLRFLGSTIVVVISVFVLYMYLYLYRRKITTHNGLFFLVYLTMALVMGASLVLTQFEITNSYLIPVALAPIILTIIFDSRVGLFASFTLSTLIALTYGNDFEYVVASISACSLGVFSVRDIKNRAQFFFTTPGVVFITTILVMGAFSLAKLEGWDAFLNNLLYVAISSLIILFTYPIILLFEKLFGITTDFTLLELGDTNQPLLKELMNKAPGTFHHSLQVANLSEAAASAIGGNSLLCRVGALYHDIGKMVKPGYFVENQVSGENEHDKLKPQMSAMIIKAHVSEGVKMAEEHKLPNVLIQFIRTHHGNSLIKYFYDKAQAGGNDKEATVEDTFRYEGPLPSTKETGILLLADGIEAASRAMKNPTYSKLENLVSRMIDERVAEGQLSHCPLTFRDLQVIKETFLNILVGIYHSRVEYPEDKTETEETSTTEQQPA